MRADSRLLFVSSSSTLRGIRTRFRCCCRRYWGISSIPILNAEYSRTFSYFVDDNLPYVILQVLSLKGYPLSSILPTLLGHYQYSMYRCRNHTHLQILFILVLAWENDLPKSNEPAFAKRSGLRGDVSFFLLLAHPPKHA